MIDAQVDGWPLWLRAIVCLIASPAVFVLTLVVIKVVTGGQRRD